MSNTSSIKIMTADDLSPLLGRAVNTIKTDVRRRPETLPPRLRIPGSNRLLWLEQDVIDWLNQCRVTSYRAGKATRR
jgi:predicted DNA-binding transcriptional regulator AlpA